MVEDSGWGTKKNKRAIKSFLHFLRRFNDRKEVAFIEHIFPEDMDQRSGKIIRKVFPQVYSISEELTASIVKELAYKCAYGRPNSQHKAAESLAFAWLCLTASRIRLPRYLESVHAIQSNALIFSKEYPELFVPSHFGKQKIRISNRIAKFLKVVSEIPSPAPRKTILQSSLHDLRRALNDAIKKVNPPSDIGKITFLTFLSSLHDAGLHIR